MPTDVHLEMIIRYPTLDGRLHILSKSHERELGRKATRRREVASYDGGHCDLHGRDKLEK
jgi:hypothetical protein